MTHVKAVLLKELGHGTFVTTLSVFNELSEDFSAGYKEMMQISSSAGTIRGVTEMLNRKTDLLCWKRVNRKRRASTTEARHEILTNDRGHPFPTDLIKFQFSDMGFQFADKPLLHDVNLSVSQGSIVAILGEHGGGRQTFLKLIGHEIFPTSGDLFIPTHLRILHVSQEVFVLDTSLLHNLTFGNPNADVEIIMHLLERLGAHKLADGVRKDLEDMTSERSHLTQDSQEAEEEDDHACCLGVDCCKEEPSESLQNNKHWVDTLSYSETAKLHLARALLMNPEVMVLQRPLLHFNQHDQKDVLDLLHEHVGNRGFGLPSENMSMRRPRTVFLSVENQEQADRADVVWMVEGTGAKSSVSVKKQDTPQTSEMPRSFTRPSESNLSAFTIQIPEYSKGLPLLEYPSDQGSAWPMATLPSYLV